LRPEQPLGELRLVDRALATSGSGTQYFIHERRRYGHLLDPRSGWPAEGILSATVIAPNAATADALSTAFYVLGVEASRRFCLAHPGVAAVLVTPGRYAGDVEVHTLGDLAGTWSPEQSSAT
jgi:thiamine biosynthesis lipoprotein